MCGVVRIDETGHQAEFCVGLECNVIVSCAFNTTYRLMAFLCISVMRVAVGRSVRLWLACLPGDAGSAMSCDVRPG